MQLSTVLSHSSTKFDSTPISRFNDNCTFITPHILQLTLSTLYTFAVNPSTASINSSETEIQQSSDEDTLVLFYSLTSLLVLLLTALTVVMCILALCCYGYQKRLRVKTRPLPRQHNIAMVTTHERIPMPTSKFTNQNYKETGVMMGQGPVVERSKVSSSSCLTDSTYYTHSSPESTV